MSNAASSSVSGERGSGIRGLQFDPGWGPPKDRSHWADKGTGGRPRARGRGGVSASAERRRIVEVQQGEVKSGVSLEKWYNLGIGLLLDQITVATFIPKDDDNGGGAASLPTHKQSGLEVIFDVVQKIEAMEDAERKQHDKLRKQAMDVIDTAIEGRTLTIALFHGGTTEVTFSEQDTGFVWGLMATAET